ncbi:lysM domain receptor-like kinase 4 [Impatiens glandulifera]|uniref:lysM domain receptor-like kinase 4 n=1 Tax=Impatiens glandulifera TaxID=253017 RepID=UPI001FB08E00|nr:lysM domain receptor-like kinase 4 [Impatiens glandulifera]
MDRILLAFLVSFAFFISILDAQQNYSGISSMNCHAKDETGPSPAFLYSCNGESSCQTFLMFRSRSPYDSVMSISNLTSSDPSQLSKINNVSMDSVFVRGQEVIVPVNCSCNGQYYQANTSYVTPTIYETYYTIAKDTFEELSTCSILMKENIYGEFELGYVGLRLNVPLRCACPTRNQTINGTKFLFTYLVAPGDNITSISRRFNVTPVSIAYSNGFVDVDNAVLQSSTTILIPLREEPLSSQMIVIEEDVVTLSPAPILAPSSHKVRNRRRDIYVGIGVGLLASCLFCLTLYTFLHRRRTRTMTTKIYNHKGNARNQPSKDLLNGIATVDQVLKVFTFRELETGTQSFNQINQLSDLVYRGFLNERMFAVKKMTADVSKEVKILHKFNHFNLITLLGVCEHFGVFYLVYEFMEMGSLRNWLNTKENDSNCKQLCNWSNRIRIAIDIASGLHYIHNFTEPAYVHKDINSGNILLNQDLRAKVANFGLAKSANQNGYSSMRCVPCAKGYLAPEYAEAGLVTPMMDVYAFGVVVLELVTGKDAVFKENGKEIQLSDWVIWIMDGGNGSIVEFIDRRLQVRHPLGYMIDQSEPAGRLLRLSLACLAQEPEQRPTMAEVVNALMMIQIDVQRIECSMFVP